MKSDKTHWYSLTYVLAFLIGVTLFWSFGKEWLDLKSASTFLAGLIGIAVAVLALGAWNIYYNSRYKEN
jgi:prolipoprotein diacylglyceryltransferase